MSLRIIKAGVADTIQDCGRYGWQYLGINPTGVMDRFAANIANLLAGNGSHIPVIELHFPASIFLFQQPALIALAGGDFSATINGESLPSSHPVFVNKNSILQFHEPKKGARAYLAVNGGFEIPQWLNSSSTHLKAKTGGYKGRNLQKDDEITINQTIDLSKKISGREFYILTWIADSNWGDV
jgi:antagonist of KipI